MKHIPFFMRFVQLKSKCIWRVFYNMLKLQTAKIYVGNFFKFVFMHITSYIFIKLLFCRCFYCSKHQTYLWISSIFKLSRTYNAISLDSKSHHLQSICTMPLFFLIKSCSTIYASTEIVSVSPFIRLLFGLSKTTVHLSC